MIDSVQYWLVGLSIYHFGLDQDIFASISLFAAMKYYMDIHSPQKMNP